MRGVVSRLFSFFLSNLRYLVDLSEDSLGETMFVKCFDNGARVLIEFGFWSQGLIWRTTQCLPADFDKVKSETGGTTKSFFLYPSSWPISLWAHRWTFSLLLNVQGHTILSKILSKLSEIKWRWSSQSRVSVVHLIAGDKHLGKCQNCQSKRKFSMIYSDLLQTFFWLF